MRSVRASGVEGVVECILGMVVVSTPISVGKRGAILALAADFSSDFFEKSAGG
jgi:hypothetical protein